MKTLARTLAAALVLAPALAMGQVTTFNVDPVHSHASFSIRHMVIANVRGEFQKLSGTVAIDEKDVTKSKVDVTLEAASVNTREPKRDDDLRSPNFFDVEKFPTLTFKSTKVEKAGAGKLKVTGDLTMHGVTRPLVLTVAGPTEAVKDPWGSTRRGASATAKLDRRDWGLTWSKVLEGGGAIVGNDVAIELEVELVKQ